MRITHGLSLLPIAVTILNIPYNTHGHGTQRIKSRLITVLWNSSISMFTLIDYYSFTIPVKYVFGKALFDADNIFSVTAFLQILNVQSVRDEFSQDWEAENAYGFYATRLRHSTSKIALSYGSINEHIFVELAGQACANLDSRDLLNPLIEKTHQRATRIDFAVDIKTDLAPKVFIEARSNKSFKSSGNKYSPTGATEYLGGRTSERMARVYRYYAPHPRHEYLRVEAEYKGDAAKAATKHLVETNVQQACVDAHVPFGWQHTIWDIQDIDSRRITYKAYHPNSASTLVWIYGDVVTAIRKAARAGLLDLEEWLEFLREGLKEEE